MVEKLGPKELVRIASFDASCNEMAGERVVSTPNGEPWPHEEIDFYLKNLFPCQRPPVDESDDSFVIYSDLHAMCMTERTRQIHRMLVADRICWKSEGADANRDLAGRIEKLCGSDELSSAEARERCEKYAASVRAAATPTLWQEFGGWLGGAAFFIFLFGGPAHDIYQFAKEKVKSMGRKDPPDGPGSSGGGRFGDGPVIDAKFTHRDETGQETRDSAATESLSAAGLAMLIGAGAMRFAEAAARTISIFPKVVLTVPSMLIMVPSPVLEKAMSPGGDFPPDA